jgi:hypothetical protein
MNENSNNNSNIVQQEQFNSFISQMMGELEALKLQNGHLLNELRIVKNSNTTKHTLKVNKPTEYHGDRKETKAFIAQNELVFSAQPMQFVNDQNKITYFASFLKGNAFHWYYNLMNKGALPHKYKDFITVFQTYFGQQDEQNFAEQKIQSLYQGSSIAQYNQQFNKYAMLIDYNDTALMNIYRKGLKGKVKDLLLACDKPKTLLSLQDKCLEIDNRLMEDQNQRDNSNFNYRKYNNYKEKKFEPMEIDNINLRNQQSSRDNNKIKQLSTEDKKYRRLNNLCLYCGKDNCGGVRDTNNCIIIKKKNNMTQSPLNRRPSL